MALLMALMVVALAIGPASAATVPVNSSMSNTAIQTAITNANSGDTIYFEPGTYNGISLSTSKALNFVGNEVELIGDGTNPVFTISSSNGVSITGFTINVNAFKNAITGSNVYNCNIENNTIENGGEGINIYQSYQNLTIKNNTINNMSTHYGDGISLVNCGTPETTTSTKITNNIVSNINYGIFLGGYFTGTVSGNTISNSAIAGMNITGKHSPTTGSLNANITDNTIPGMAMENPNVICLYLNNNTIGQVGSSGYSVLTNSYFTKDPSGTITVTNNAFDYPVDDTFKAVADEDLWSGNTLNGRSYPY